MEPGLQSLIRRVSSNRCRGHSTRIVHARPGHTYSWGDAWPIIVEPFALMWRNQRKFLDTVISVRVNVYFVETSKEQ